MARLKQTIVCVGGGKHVIYRQRQFSKKIAAVCLRYDIGMASEFVTHKKRQIDRKKELRPAFKNPSS